jgi:hypothetical protein
MLCLIVLAVGLILASLYGIMPLTRTTEAAPAPSAEASFKGKVLLVSMANMSVYLVEKAQVQKIGDQSCLVGKGAGEGKMTTWYKGRTVWLRMENIVSITEFDDHKEAQKALESGGASPFGGYVVPAAVEATPAVPGVAPVPAVPPPPPAKQ